MKKKSIIIISSIAIMGILMFLITACDKKLTKEEAQFKIFLKKADPEKFRGYLTPKKNPELKDSIEKWKADYAPVKLRLIGAYSQYILNYEYAVFELKIFSNKDYFIVASNSVRINSIFIQKGDNDDWSFTNAKGLRRTKGDIEIVPLFRNESIFLLCDFHLISGKFLQFRYYVGPKEINEVNFFQEAKKKYGEKLLFGPFETSVIDDLNEKFKGVNWAGPRAFNFENLAKRNNSFKNPVPPKNSSEKPLN
jgi:hypothetical protein